MTSSVYNLLVNNTIGFTPGPTAGYVLSIGASGDTYWNTSGGVGATGPAGPTGATGANGTGMPAGSSETYYYLSVVGAGSQSATSSFQLANHQDVTGATVNSIPVVAGGVYKIDYNILYSSSVSTTGIRLGITSSMTATFSGLVRTNVAVDGQTAQFIGSLTSLNNDIVTTTGVETANVIYLARIEAMLIPGSSGTFSLIWAAETNNNIWLNNGGVLLLKRFK